MRLLVFLKGYVLFFWTKTQELMTLDAYSLLQAIILLHISSVSNFSIREHSDLVYFSGYTSKTIIMTGKNEKERIKTKE